MGLNPTERVAVITGGGVGSGLAVARALASDVASANECDTLVAQVVEFYSRPKDNFVFMRSPPFERSSS